ncbi:MAG TPA: tRNA pseudouridine(13) synthase TruD [Patescibacteria group bacterium]|nr:tRNA pseudouridine(13) synthase TruD [Patescibacteria group bacterium]
MIKNSDQIFALWQQEQIYLQSVKEKHPELFVKKPEIEETDTLSRVGISMPFIDRPLGYLKHHPFDFIVEEIQKNGDVSTVDYAPFTAEPVGDEQRTIYADLVKVGVSTVDAVKELCRGLSIEERQVGIAGIKDATALTSQRVSIRGVSIESLSGAQFASLFLKNIHADKGAINIGDLLGNRFTLFIRTEQGINQDDLMDKINDLGKNGFWNFYWLQRFGNRLLSHWWGLLLFQGNYKEVVRSYMCDPGPRELPAIAFARQEAGNDFGNWEKMKNILSPFCYSLRHELILLEYLSKNPNNFLGALKLIPEQIKLWTYAYASYLFNRFLSTYATNHGSYTAKLPLILSPDQRDRQLYQPFLAADRIPKQFEQNIRPFNFIRFARREVKTRVIPIIHGVKILSEGIIISFDLEKGAYATTFLAHLFTLVSGLPVPEWVKTKEYDLKETLGTGSLKETKEKLKKYIIEKETGEESSE